MMSAVTIMKLSPVGQFQQETPVGMSREILACEVLKFIYSSFMKHLLYASHGIRQRANKDE